ncbi:hypothetical protein BKA62DRAFT_487927 [Auriculariales sp. MPI-PUGE-AT-0066]|nr:hypothetical protein BKA62DRAFT_487927 [Auriculariales sp. MPI-PUGE-AT-0066]
METLPVELVAYVFQMTAYMFRSTDRSTVVNLALTSSFVYDTVAPILYEMIIIKFNTQSENSFSVFAKDEAIAAKVLKHVRFLCTGWRVVEISSSTAAFFSNLETIHGPFSTWCTITLAQAKHGHAIASDARFWEIGLPRNIDSNQQLCSLTRLHTFIPSTSLPHTFREISHDADGWTRRMLTLLPALTHMGFSHYGLDISHENWEEKDLRVFEMILRTLAACRRPFLQIMAFRLTGRATRCLDAYVRVAQGAEEDLALRRVRFWADTRDIPTWDAESEVMINDARAGRSIWTEAKPWSLHVNLAQGLNPVK